MPRRATRGLHVALLATVLSGLLWGCGEAPPSPPTTGPPGQRAAEPPPPPGVPEPPALREVYDREFLFVSLATDSLVLVPWFFRSWDDPEEVRRQAQVWLGRAGAWEVLAQEETVLPPGRSPWQILPTGTVRPGVGEADRVETLRVGPSAREVELRVDAFITDWLAPDADPIWLSEGRTLFPSGPMDGFVLEVNRRWQFPDDLRGDWIFLHSGNELQLFLEAVPSGSPAAAPGPPPPPGARSYRGWSRFVFQNALWSGLTVQWEDPRPFEPARRDIPSSWSVSSPGGDLAGELRSTGSHLTAGEGDGPILPVTGFFSVEGTISLRGEPFEVVGIVRHEQR